MLDGPFRTAVLAGPKRARRRAKGAARKGFVNGSVAGAAEYQPVRLTARDETAVAQVLFLSDGASSRSLAAYETCANLFDGTD